MLCILERETHFSIISFLRRAQNEEVWTYFFLLQRKIPFKLKLFIAQCFHLEKSQLECANYHQHCSPSPCRRATHRIEKYLKFLPPIYYDFVSAINERLNRAIIKSLKWKLNKFWNIWKLILLAVSDLYAKLSENSKILLEKEAYRVLIWFSNEPWTFRFKINLRFLVVTSKKSVYKISELEVADG